MSTEWDFTTDLLCVCVCEYVCGEWVLVVKRKLNSFEVGLLDLKKTFILLLLTLTRNTIVLHFHLEESTLMCWTAFDEFLEEQLVNSGTNWKCKTDITDGP